MAENKRGVRADYLQFVSVTTRWADNDIYGHINNAAYYGYIDSAVNQLLISEDLLNPATSDKIFLVIESGCRYHAAAHYPDVIHAGIRVAHLGNSSVKYEVGLFRNAEDQAVAEGHFVHVMVGREDRRPAPITGAFRTFLETLKAR